MSGPSSSGRATGEPTGGALPDGPASTGDVAAATAAQPGAQGAAEGGTDTAVAVEGATTARGRTAARFAAQGRRAGAAVGERLQVAATGIPLEQPRTDDEETAALEEILSGDRAAAANEEADRIVVGDDPTVRVHHPGDLLTVVLSALGVALVMVMATYAQHTTTGVAEDVQGFASLLRRILIVPVRVLEGFVTLVVPLAVMTELALRRLGRQMLEAVGAAVLAIGLNQLVAWFVEQFGSEELQTGLSVLVSGVWTLTMPAYVAMLAGLLTASGPRGHRRTVTWGWNLLWVAVAVLLVTAQVSLPGLLVSLLIGRVAGMLVRYVSGVRSERAYGASLVAGIRRAGFDPVTVRRVAQRGEAATEPHGAARALVRSTGYRMYEVRTTEGSDLDLLVVDGDRQVVGILSRLWRSMRLRGIEGRTVVTMRQTTERTALLAYAARAAGVRTPQVLRVAEAEDSMLLVQTRPVGARPLTDLTPDDLTDEVLAGIWGQLTLAHEAGIAHRALTSDTVLVDSSGDEPQVWLIGWDQGYVASSELARRMDVTQMLALLALRVGAVRALDSAASTLTEEGVATIGPLLQTITLPHRTREEVRQNKKVLGELREAIVARIPEADVQPQQLVRFGARTVLTIVLPIVAVFFIVTRINFDEIAGAVSESDWRWTALAFGLGLLTLLGAAMALVAFAPARIPLWRAVLVQAAASWVALAAPAGIGPAALNLRMLTRRGLSTSLAAATVALVQVSQFTVTIVLLLVLTLISGGSESALPISSTMLLVIGILAAVVAAMLLIPAVRQRALAIVMPTLRQTWPRLVDVLGRPWRLVIAITGNLLMTLGYVLAFDACLAAFGQHASLIQVAIVYLTGNTAGAMVPTPGGMFAIELALATSLSAVTGINLGIATSVAILFRVVTYWVRIPIGYVSMRYLQKLGEL